MKRTIFLLILALGFSNVKSQSVTIDISKSGLNQPNNYYRKDINNVLNQFEGTFLYTSGNRSFKIIFEKKIKQYNGSYYEDLIIGEYQYIVGGVEQFNTLSNLNVVYNNQYIKHSIAANSPIENNNREWKCTQCIANEKRLRGKIVDKSTDRIASIFLRKTIIGGQEVLQVKISQVRPDFENTNSPDFSLPKGEFTMVKQ